MASKNNNEDALFIGLGSLLVGAALASPNMNEVAKMQEFKNNEMLFRHFKSHLKEFQAFLIQNQEENRRIATLGEIRVKQGIQSYPKEGSLFNEAIELYIKGFFRFSSIACTMVIESILKRRFGKMSFAALIDKAESDSILKKNDRNYIDGLRLDRNDHVHSVDHEIDEDHAKLAIIVTTRVLNNIL